MQHPERANGIGSDATVAEVMTRLVVAVRRTDSVRLVIDRILSEKISAVPVLDDAGHPVGLLSRLDLLRAAGLGHALTAEELMPGSVHAIGPEATVALAAATMADLHVHRLIVVDEEGVAVGMVSSLDVMRWLAERAGYGLDA